MSTWFSADHHFGNENITGHVGRKLAGWEREFVNAGEMDARMIARWNEVVLPDDTVYYLGDFTLLSGKVMLQYLDRLTGQIKFVPGGHDLSWMKDLGFKPNETGFLPRPYHKHEILPMLHFLKMKIDGLEAQAGAKKRSLLVLCHYPLFSWERSHKGSWHLHGHSHGGLGKANRYQKIVKSLPSTLEDFHTLDVGVDATWDFYPVHMQTIVDKLGADEEG